MATLPNATFAVDGFSFTGLALYVAEVGTEYVPAWCGEFHGTVGDGRISEFARSASARFAYIFVSDHRTGETRYVPLTFAQTHAL